MNSKTNFTDQISKDVKTIAKESSPHSSRSNSSRSRSRDSSASKSSPSRSKSKGKTVKKVLDASDKRQKKVVEVITFSAYSNTEKLQLND